MVVELGFVSGAERGNSNLAFVVVVTPLAGFSLVLQFRDIEKETQKYKSS